MCVCVWVCVLADFRSNVCYTHYALCVLYTCTCVVPQVLGKPAANLKLSHFKQILKSCRGGVSLLVHRMPGDRRSQQRDPSLAHSSLTLRGIREAGDHHSVSDFPSSFQAPGTPGSNLSETTGYYSTQSTSLPSVCSAAISPGGPEARTGMTSLPGFVRQASPSLNLKSATASQTSASQHSGYETDQANFDALSHFRENSVSNSTANAFTSSSRSVLGDISNPYTVRPLYLTGMGGSGINGNSSRNRMSSQSSYGGSSQLSSSVLSNSVLSPKSDATTSSSSRFAFSSRSGSNRHQIPPPPSPFSTVPRNSFSVDRLESASRLPPHQHMSGDSHMTSSSSLLAGVGPHSMSTSNVYRMELGKRTNVWSYSNEWPTTFTLCVCVCAWMYIMCVFVCWMFRNQLLTNNLSHP